MIESKLDRIRTNKKIVEQNNIQTTNCIKKNVEFNFTINI